MSRIENIFNGLRSTGRGALMPFLTAGYPSLESTEKTILAIEQSGASIVELGFPFTDPIADGPVIAASMHEALQAGVSPQNIFNLVSRVRPATEIGLVAMVSHSIVNRMGSEHFVDAAAVAGFDGLIVPDIDLADAGDLLALAGSKGLGFSLLIAPTTSESRIAEITAVCRGFVYVLARAGITGEQHAAPDITRRVEVIRRHTDLPLAVGFGISTAEHVRAVTQVADAAIVGSALVRRMGESTDPVAAAVSFTAELAEGLDAGA